MDDQQPANDLNKWFSTYGLITAERILGKYQIKLPNDILMAAVRNPLSFYHKILQVPLKNVLTGIIIQQAYDYHVYVQKLFIDYLLAPESAVPDTSPGAPTRQALEEERNNLLVIGDAFHELELKQDSLIATSQSTLINATKEWNLAQEHLVMSLLALLKKHNIDKEKKEIQLAVHHVMANTNIETPYENELINSINEVLNIETIMGLKEEIEPRFEEVKAIASSFDVSLASFYETTLELSTSARSFRTQFYDCIIRVLELLKMVPDYKINEEQDKINREPLYFDKSIGEIE